MYAKIAKVAALSILAVVVAACSGSPASPAPAAEPATATPSEAEVPAAPTVGGQRTFVIVPEESKASYLANEELFAGAFDKYGLSPGLADVVGTTQAIEGQLQLDLDNLDDALGENSFTVQMNTFTTDQSFRDNWIRDNGPRFNQYPEATFRATAVEGAPASYTDGQEVTFQLIGDLTIREIARPTTFDVTASLAGDTLTGKATARMLMSDFGIDPPSFANTLTVADEFGIEVEFVAREQK